MLLEKLKMVEVKVRMHVIPTPELWEYGLIMAKAAVGVGH